MRQKNSDIIILGAGLVGAALALRLAQDGLQVTVFDRQDLSAKPPNDHRTTAISYGSSQILAGVGVWQKLLPKAQPIRAIQILDATTRLDFDHRLVRAEPMGHIIENAALRLELRLAMASQKNLQLISPITLQDLKADAGEITATSGGKSWRAAAAVIADGRQSVWRDKLGLSVRRHDYGQTAVIANVTHALPHDDTAFECFLPAGPLALLPMPDWRGRPQSSLVWTEPKNRAQALQALAADEFCALLQERFGDHLGSFAISGPRQAYPLDIVYATPVYAARAVVIGDAAHGIHPIAGQGLNLGLRDVALLADLFAQQAARGMDLGSPLLLADYARRRSFDTVSMQAATHGLNWLFGQKAVPITSARRLGLRLVDAIPGLKPAFIKRAMGDF